VNSLNESNIFFKNQLLYYRIEKQIVTEVGENINDSEFPSLITNIPKLSILSVST